MTSNSVDVRKSQPKNSFRCKAKMSPIGVTPKSHWATQHPCRGVKAIAMPTIDPKAIGQRIATMRKAKDWSIQHLSIKSGLKISTLYAFECGARVPRRDSLMRIALALTRSMDWFLWGRHRGGKSRKQRGPRPGSVSDSVLALDSDARSATMYDGKVSSR